VHINDGIDALKRFKLVFKMKNASTPIVGEGNVEMKGSKETKASPD